jgi:hypothetical protein
MHTLMDFLHLLAAARSTSAPVWYVSVWPEGQRRVGVAEWHWVTNRGTCWVTVRGVRIKPGSTVAWHRGVPCVLVTPHLVQAESDELAIGFEDALRVALCEARQRLPPERRRSQSGRVSQHDDDQTLDAWKARGLLRTGREMVDLATSA